MLSVESSVGSPPFAWTWLLSGAGALTSIGYCAFPPAILFCANKFTVWDPSRPYAGSGFSCATWVFAALDFWKRLWLVQLVNMRDLSGGACCCGCRDLESRAPLSWCSDSMFPT